MCIAKKRVRTLFAIAQQPYSRDIFINQKILPFNKLISQQEGEHAYKVINGTYLLNNFLIHGIVRHQIQLRNIGDLRTPLYATTHSKLFVLYRAINTWNGLSDDLGSLSSFCTFKNKLRQLYQSLTKFPYIVSMIIIIIIIIIIILESAVQGRERVRTLYQSKDNNPTQPTHGRKKKIKQ